MAIVAVSVTKRTAFRDSTQEFTNTYHYFCAALPNAATAESLIDQVTANEKSFHSSGVTFVRGRAWSETGNKQTNQMIAQKVLSGTGNVGGDPAFDKERAYLVRWPAGNDSRGKPVYLRKWYHTCTSIPNAAVTDPIRANVSGFTQAQRDAVALQGATLESLNAGAFDLCAASGRRRTGSAQAHKYLEHHQLGDQWRQL